MKERQAKSLEYALSVIHKSDLKPYILEIIMFGSCARGQERYDSDVDLMVIIDDRAEKNPEIHRMMRRLICAVVPDEITMPEVDLKIYYSGNFNMERSFFLENIKREGVVIWQK